MTSWRILLPNRRWLQIRLRTVFLLATALCVYFAWPHVERQYAVWQLRGYGELRHYDYLRFEGKDRDGKPTLLEGIRVEDFLRLLIPSRERFSGVSPGILMISPINCGRERLVAVQLPHSFASQGDNPIRIVLLDRQGRILSDQVEILVDCYYPTEAWHESTPSGTPRIVLATGHGRQFFTIENDKIIPERAEMQKD